MELKSRTRSQLPLVNQSVSAVQRDNEERVVYAGRTADLNLGSFDYEGWPMLKDADANLATVPGCIKTGGESVGLRNEISRQSRVEWIPFVITPKGEKKETRSDQWTCFCSPISWTALDFIFDHHPSHFQLIFFNKRFEKRSCRQ